MKSSAEIKRFFKQKFGINVRCNTSAGKSHWQRAFIVPNRTENFRDSLTYPASFPEGFRRLCLSVVYPDSPTLQAQSSAGNIMEHSIVMKSPQWEKVIDTLNAVLDVVESVVINNQ